VTALTRNRDPDPDLIRRAGNGHGPSLRSLLEEVAPWVSQWAVARTGDPDEAQDLAQEVLILMVKKLPSFRGESRFSTWLFTVTRNQAIEGHRSRKRQERKMERFATHMAGEGPSAPDTDASVDQGRMASIVRTFLRKLPPRQREVFQMAELQGLTSPEIGELLGLDPGSVRAALFKARRTLRKMILDHHPEFVEEYTG